MADVINNSNSQIRKEDFKTEIYKPSKKLTSGGKDRNKSKMQCRPSAPIIP